MLSLAEYTSSENDVAEPRPAIKRNSLTPFRNILKTGGVPLLAAGGFNSENAAPKVESDGADCIAFGKYFIANPDLVERLKNEWPLNSYDRSTFYGADPLEKGYNDYPFYTEVKTNGSS